MQLVPYKEDRWKQIVLKASQSIALTFALLIAIISAFTGKDNSITLFGNIFTYPQVILILLGTFFAELLFERLTTFNQIEHSAITLNYIKNNVVPFFDRFSSGEHHRFYELLWKYMFRGEATWDQNKAEFTVSRHDSISLWRDCISEAGQWQALSYAPDLWQPGEVEIAKAHQQVFIKLRHVELLTRVFVFDTEAERHAFYEKNIEIASTGNVRYILRSTLDKLVKDRYGGHSPDSDLIDFAIADNGNYVLWFRLEDKRLTHATLYVDRKRIEVARTIFDIALTNGTTFPQIRTTVGMP